jgi:hypothetical protein
MTQKQRAAATTDNIAQLDLWGAAVSGQLSSWQEWLEKQVYMHGLARLRAGLLAWLRAHVEILLQSYPEVLTSKRKPKGKRAVALFSLSGAPNDDDPACFGHWPSAGVVYGGVGIAIELPEHPKQVKGSRLIDVIEQDQVSERYFLSPHAARGILRRCALMKRPLFHPLHLALELLARADEPERKDRGEERW